MIKNTDSWVPITRNSNLVSLSMNLCFKNTPRVIRTVKPSLRDYQQYVISKTPSGAECPGFQDYRLGKYQLCCMYIQAHQTLTFPGTRAL